MYNGQQDPIPARYTPPSSDAPGVRSHRTVKIRNPEDLVLQRQKCGMSQADLADALGLTRSAVTQWETGRVQSIQRETAFRLARILRAPSGYLFIEVPGGGSCPA